MKRILISVCIVFGLVAGYFGWSAVQEKRGVMSEYLAAKEKKEKPAKEKSKPGVHRPQEKPAPKPVKVISAVHKDPAEGAKVSLVSNEKRQPAPEKCQGECINPEDFYKFYEKYFGEGQVKAYGILSKFVKKTKNPRANIEFFGVYDSKFRKRGIIGLHDYYPELGVAASKAVVLFSQSYPGKAGELLQKDFYWGEFRKIEGQLAEMKKLHDEFYGASEKRKIKLCQSLGGYIEAVMEIDVP